MAPRRQSPIFLVLIMVGYGFLVYDFFNDYYVLLWLLFLAAESLLHLHAHFSPGLETLAQLPSPVSKIISIRTLILNSLPAKLGNWPILQDPRLWSYTPPLLI